MATNSKTTTTKTTNKATQSKDAMNRFKMEVASSLGVPLKDGYNGNLTAAQSGSVGGEMVRQMIKKQEENMNK